MDGLDHSFRGLRLLALIVAPAIPVIVMAFLLIQYTQDWTTERATTNAAGVAALVADLTISPQFTEDDFTSASIDPQRVEQLDATLAPVLGDTIIRVKVWDANGRVIYSDDRDTVGQTFEISHELEDALNGETASEVSELDKQENVAEQEFDRLLEVYTPVSVGDGSSIDGAFELYLPYDPIAESIQTDTRRIFSMLAATLALLYLALAYVALMWARSHRRAESQEHQANHDPLTGLANRRRFQSELEALALSQPEQLVAVLFIDLDDFKNVNDQHGHTVGDSLLRAVSGRLKGVLRDEAVVARLGGDEFAVLIPRLQSLRVAGDIAERLITSLETPFTVDEHTVSVQASIGIDVTTADQIDTDMMQRNADAAMYAAKSAGKAQYATFNPELNKFLNQIQNAATTDR